MLVRRLPRLGLLGLWLCASCADEKGPPVQLVVAHGLSADGRCAPDTGRPTDATVPASNISKVRLSVRLHAAGDTAGRFLCDRILDVPKDQPNLKLPLGGADTVDLYAEGFREAAVDDPLNATVGKFRRVATGALLGLSGKSKTIDPLRMFPVETFRCVDARLKRARAFHSATRLPSGHVLIVGGVVASPSDTSAEALTMNRLYLIGDAELYDPSTGKFKTVMEAAPTPRAFHQAALLNDKPPYQILLVGGVTIKDPTMPALDVNTGGLGEPRLVPFDTSQTFPVPLTTKAAGAELLVYDPSTGVATRTDVNGFPASAFPGAAALGAAGTDGVVLAGGIAYGNPPDMIVASTKTAVQRAGETAPRMGTGQASRLGGTVTPLGGDTALVWGGATADTDPVGELLTGLGAGSSMMSAAVSAGTTPMTQFHTATMFGSGSGMSQILVTGGFILDSGKATQPPAPADAARIVSVGTGGMATATAVTLGGGYVADTMCMNAKRYRPAGWESAVGLSRGRVLVTGGAPTYIASGGGCNDCDIGGSLLCSLKQASLFTPPSTLAPAAETLEIGRFGHSSTLLGDGAVLIVGGMTLPVAGMPSRTVPDAEVYNPRTAVPPYDATMGGLDGDDPVAGDLTALQLTRAPGGAAYTVGGDATKAAKRCGDL
jgi:hypothetical protein